MNEYRLLHSILPFLNERALNTSLAGQERGNRIRQRGLWSPYYLNGTYLQLNQVADQNTTQPSGLEIVGRRQDEGRIQFSPQYMHLQVNGVSKTLGTDNIAVNVAEVQRRPQPTLSFDALAGGQQFVPFKLWITYTQARGIATQRLVDIGHGLKITLPPSKFVQAVPALIPPATLFSELPVGVSQPDTGTGIYESAITGTLDCVDSPYYPYSAPLTQSAFFSAVGRERLDIIPPGARRLSVSNQFAVTAPTIRLTFEWGDDNFGTTVESLIVGTEQTPIEVPQNAQIWRATALALPEGPVSTNLKWQIEF